jgi:hypothetical protein
MGENIYVKFGFPLTDMRLVDWDVCVVSQRNEIKDKLPQATNPLLRVTAAFLIRELLAPCVSELFGEYWFRNPFRNAEVPKLSEICGFFFVFEPGAMLQINEVSK